MAAYGFAAIVGCVRLFRRKSHSRSMTYPIILVGFLLQSSGLYLRGMEIGACPLGNTFEIVQFVLWSTIFLFLVVGPVFQVHLLGTTTAALAVVAGVFSLMVSSWDNPHSEALFGGDPLIEFHAAVSIFSYGIFGLLSTVALLYLIQYNALERKWRSRIFNLLPSIVKLDNLARRLLSAGVLILSLAFASGIMVWFDEAWSQLHWKLITVFILWLGYGGVWILRLRQRFSPHRAAICFLTLYIFALFSLWPVNQSHELRSPVKSSPSEATSTSAAE
jgi:ABC-type uncharacterized transport system permease subunit